MSNGNDVSIVTLTASQIAALMYTQYDFQTASPTTGQTVQMNDNNLDGTLYLTPAAGLAALTITFPSDANSRIGQIRRFATNKSVAILTMAGATILNNVTALVANDCFSYQKVAANTWVRLQ